MVASIITFDVTLFRAQFKAFRDVLEYPDLLLQMYWDMAICYVSDLNCGDLQGSCRQLALNLATAHLAALNDIINAGETGGITQSASIDKISVTLVPPPERDEWTWWYNQTPYGQQLISLLQVNAVGGFYYGALPERAGFRKIYGIF